MPTFLVTGIGRETGRKRQRTFDAKDEVHARTLAEADGTSVDAINRVPDEPATERQLSYAKDLGISVPSGATKEEVSDLLDVYLEHDKPADARHIGFAERYGVRYTQYSGKKALYNRIHATLSAPGREKEITAWFVYRVYRELVEGREHVSIDGPEHSVIQDVTAELVQDESVLKSIRRYRGNELIWFGEWTAPDGTVHTGGSNKTIAYKRAAVLLRERIGSELRSAPSRTAQIGSEHSNQAQLRRKESTGCLSVVALFACGLALIVGVVSWLDQFVA
jgi:hypothetical protein